MHDYLLQEKFDKVFFKIKNKISRDKKLEIDEAVRIITDEKVFMHQHEKAYEKIIKLENLLKNLKIDIPLELNYRKASIYLEFKSEYKEAEKILLELINNTEIDEFLENRCKFALCKIYLKEILLEPDNIQKYIDKATEQYLYLQEKLYLKKLDDYISSGLWELKLSMDEIKNNALFVVLSFPDDKENKYLSMEEAIKNIDKTDIFIDLIRRFVLINQLEEHFSDDNIKLLYLFAKKSNSQEVQNILEVTRANFDQKINRFRKKLEKLGIETRKREYRFNSLLKVKVLYKIDEENEMYHSLIYSI